jgi:hypothetical protein
MSEYTVTVVPPAQEPVLAPISERVRERSLHDIPSEDELRYLGNMKQYCNLELGDINDCLCSGKAKSDSKLFLRCKSNLERLHDCYMLREPGDHAYRGAFLEETSPCLYSRDSLLKCAFQQAENWSTCQPIWTEVYRCLFRQHPDKFTFN